MSATSDAFMSIFGLKSAKGGCCPDCGSPTEADGSCPECGYGEDESDETGTLLEIRDDLQRIVAKLADLIKNSE